MEKTKGCKMRSDEVKQGEPEYDGEPYILQLPDHIIVKIFCKISIKSLVKCRFVCKSWRRLFSNQQFIKDLFSQTPAYLWVTDATPRTPEKCQFLVDWDNASSPGDVALKVSEELPCGRKFVGVCNGLICHVYRDRDFEMSVMSPIKFYISNPITGESVHLLCPLEETSIAHLGTGFGYSPKCQVYKIVLLRRVPWKVMVLTVGSENWRSISYPYCYLEQDNGVYVNGYLHWIGQCSKGSMVIHSFNLENESFEQLPMPPCCLDSQRAQLNLGISNDCLSITVRGSYYISLWVMKNCGVNESWTKEVNIREIIGGDMKPSCEDPTFVLEYTKQRQLLLLKGNLQSYTPKDGLVKNEVDGIPYIHDAAYVRIQGFVLLKDLIRGLSL